MISRWARPKKPPGAANSARCLFCNNTLETNLSFQYDAIYVDHNCSRRTTRIHARIWGNRGWYLAIAIVQEYIFRRVYRPSVEYVDLSSTTSILRRVCRLSSSASISSSTSVFPRVCRYFVGVVVFPLGISVAISSDVSIVPRLGRSFLEYVCQHFLVSDAAYKYMPGYEFRENRRSYTEGVFNISENHTGICRVRNEV